MVFSDARSKNIIIIAHCILNQNAKMDGTASCPGPILEIMDLLARSNVGILQMPCPELLCLGLDRGNKDGCFCPVAEEDTRIRLAMNQSSATEKLTLLAEELVFQILEYKRYGFNILGIVGINRSPTCGVETTVRENSETPGEGVFIEMLKGKLAQNDLDVQIKGIKAFELQAAVETIRSLVGVN